MLTQYIPGEQDTGVWYKQMKFMNSFFSGGVYRAFGSVILTDNQSNDVQLMGNVSKSLFWPGIFYTLCVMLFLMFS